MRSRLSLIPVVVLLSVGLAFVPACRKKDTDGGGGGGGDPTPPSGPIEVPAAVSSEHLLYAQLSAKDVRNSAIFTEIKDAFGKAGATAEWDKIEGELGKEIGVKPTEIDTVTAVIPELSGRGEPKFIVIIGTSKGVTKGVGFGIRPDARADSRGFYKNRADALVHFPDDRTAVILSEELAQKYLDGYAKDRKGWPMSAELTKAASGHTVFAVVQMDKLPAEARNAPDMKEFAPLFAAKAITITASLKGKELVVAGRASFPDAASAGKAKDAGQDVLNMGVKELERGMNEKPPPELAFVMPVVKEAHRALKEAKIEAVGSDVTLAGRYRADFDITKMVTEGVRRFREAGPRNEAANNLKQIGLGIHNYASANQDRIPVYAIGANGAPFKGGNDKPLLSWRVAILPYIEQDNLYKQFRLNEPWDSEHNKKLIDKMPKMYAPVGKEGKAGYTHLQMVIGPGAMQPNRYMIGNIPDGTSNTIAVVEAAEPVVWTKPDDVMMPAKLNPGDLKKKLGGQFPGGFNVLMWDGSVRFVRDAVKEDTLRLAVCPDDGMPLPADW